MHQSIQLNLFAFGFFQGGLQKADLKEYSSVTALPNHPRKRMKQYSFNLSTLKDIVEDCVAIILRPQLAFQHQQFSRKCNFRERRLLNQNSNSRILDVYSAHIWLQFIQQLCFYTIEWYGITCTSTCVKQYLTSTRFKSSIKFKGIASTKA